MNANRVPAGKNSTQMRCCMIEKTALVPARKSSVLFGNLRQSSVNVRKRCYSPRNNFEKSSENYGKWTVISENRQKHLFSLCFHNTQNITCPLLDMNFIFSCSTRYLKSERIYIEQHSFIHDNPRQF